ncbi:hypothetical protein LCGC14_0744470 [marine sediment metagenome]|uniref:ANTAR domain-containing protein n=1 Tax=marine sediment metagenome TaxID=412755 RepID=A0A0F9QQW6_9ZZZZ
MMLGLEIAQMLAGPEGRRLVATLSRLVKSQGISLKDAMSQSITHMEQIEALAQRSGRSVKEVADESLALYEASL